MRGCYSRPRPRALSSAVGHTRYMGGVPGSIPGAPTKDRTVSVHSKALLSIRWTVVRCHRPDRSVGTPRRFSSAAIVFARQSRYFSQFADRRSKGPINRLPLSQTDLDDFSFDPMQGAVAAK